VWNYINKYYKEDDKNDDFLVQEDFWTIITAFFHEKGLVSQQLDSFDYFIENSLQEIVEENAQLVLQTTAQHTGQGNDLTVNFTFFYYV